VLLPKPPWAAPDLQHLHTRRKPQLVKDPLGPGIGVCAKAFVQLDARVEVARRLVLLCYPTVLTKPRTSACHWDSPPGVMLCFRGKARHVMCNYHLNCTLMALLGLQ